MSVPNQPEIGYLRVERFNVDGVLRNWSWVGPLLAPSVRVAGRKVEDVKIALLRGSMGMASVHVPNGAALVVMQPGMFDGVFACWLAYMAGRVKLAPKAWVQMTRTIMGYFENRAREAGCTEMRIAGRDWSRILPAYEPFDLGWKRTL